MRFYIASMLLTLFSCAIGMNEISIIQVYRLSTNQEKKTGEFIFFALNRTNEVVGEIHAFTQKNEYPEQYFKHRATINLFKVKEKYCKLEIKKQLINHLIEDIEKNTEGLDLQIYIPETDNQTIALFKETGFSYLAKENIDDQYQILMTKVIFQSN